MRLTSPLAWTTCSSVEVAWRCTATSGSAVEKKRTVLARVFSITSCRRAALPVSSGERTQQTASGEKTERRRSVRMRDACSEHQPSSLLFSSSPAHVQA